MASNRGGDKSWSEIAAEAAELGKDLVKKVGNSVTKAVAAIVPSEKQEERPSQRERERGRQDVYRPEDAFGGGLVGGLISKAVGGMLRSAVSALGEQMRQAAEQAADVQDRAARIIEGSAKLRSRLGGDVRVLPPVSQSSMSSSVNGRMTKTVTLLMPVVGAGGQTAQAQVQFAEGEGASGGLTVAVRLPNGEVVQLDGGSSPSAQTIDVEWRSVDDK
ncbi:hypothetical protein C2E20_5367 [Micractinium conductrix]|uniref:Uncharacterized protein n=1 Tax=Micractinium conductrix TaxID=554055 RepID=A0A2P6VBC6_9CHLO|nr:hypothetical protein C2E20_5367 [Micractinium conductrix]|eukprot:PSC71395.1 hypothetical protein C2E20_5367 [Micractinium conductrix]